MLALALTLPTRLPPLRLALDLVMAHLRLTQAAASAASSSAQPPPGLGARFREEYPHFLNGHRRLGLSPQVLVKCHSWIVEARDSRNYFRFSGDWLVHWFVQDSREEVRRLVQCASEANQGWCGVLAQALA